MTEKVFHVKWPLQIGLIGAPDSGKSKLIPEFKKVSEDFFSEFDSPLEVVDNPGTLIEQKFDQAMGPYGGCRDNLWAYFNRFEAERTNIAEGNSFISNGTAIDTMAHAGLYVESVMLGSNSGLITPETQMEAQRAQVTITEITYLMLENQIYNFAFYLPLADKVIIPGQDEDPIGDAYNRRIDQAIRVIFGNFNMRIQMLDQPTYEEKAQTMLDTISKIVRDGVKVEVEEEPEEEPDDGRINIGDLGENAKPEDLREVVSKAINAPCKTCGDETSNESESDS